MVSVIVPNYCHSRFLDQRIQSILNQTYQDFELIILDDCSPDEGASRTIIEKYRDNPHISEIVYNEANSGSPFIQWDKGIKLAKGDLIWIAESDDYCKPELLKTLVAEFERDEKLALAYSLVELVDENSKSLHIREIVSYGVKRLAGNNYIKRYMLLSNHCRNASACLFKKKAAVNIGKEYMSYRACGDWLFWIEIAKQGNIAIVNEKLSYFRKHSGGVTHMSSVDGTEIIEKVQIFKFIIENFDISKTKILLAKKNIKYLYELKKPAFEFNIIPSEVSKIINDVNLPFYEYWLLRIINVIQQKLNIYI